MPLVIHCPTMSLYVDGDEIDLEALGKTDVKRFILVSSFAGKRTLVVNRDQIVFIEHITEDAYKRLNEMMRKQVGSNLHRVEIAPDGNFHPKGN